MSNLFHAAVLPRPTDAGEVVVTTFESGMDGVYSLLIVGMLAFLTFTAEAQNFTCKI